MARISFKLEARRSEDTSPRMFTLKALFAADLDWLRSDKLQTNVLMYLCLAAVVVTFLLSLSAALRLKMHTEVPYWVAGAVPPALSKVAYGHERNYMSLNFVHESFNQQLKGFQAADINKAIANILAAHPVAPDRSDRVLSSDDKGIVTFTELSFRLFGYRIEGVFYLYYIFLGISAALFAWAYRRNPYALLLLAAFLLIHRMILPMIKYDGQLGGITALRCMPVLAMIACMHCLMFLFESRTTPWKLVAVALQVAVIVFVIHIRSTTMWELMVVVAGSAIALLLRKGPLLDALPSTRNRWMRWPTAVPLMAAAAFMAVLKIHQAYGFPEEYYRGDQIVTRVFWHNIFSGLAFSPGFAARDNLRVDDFTTLEATRKYLLENGREKEWDATGGNVPGYTAMRWQVYEVAVKEMFFTRCAEHFGDCVAAFAYYKPVSMIKNLLWMTGLRKLPPDMDIFTSKHPEIGTVVKEQFIETTRLLDLKKERGRLWFRGLLFLAAAFAVLGKLRRRRSELLPVVVTATVLAIGSTIPSILGYPAPHTIAEVAIAVPLLLVVLAALVNPFPQKD
jgi:hypothetical protein